MEADGSSNEQEDKMNRTKVMFFTFTGKQIMDDTKILEVQDGYELWNLKMFTLDEFVAEVKDRIPPVNQNVLRNYKIDVATSDPFGLTEKQFLDCSWGLLIPDTLEEGGFSCAETMSLLNLYSPTFLYPAFYVNDMGIYRYEYNKSPFHYFHTQDDTPFRTTEFVTFYKTLFEQSKYAIWHLDRIQSWDKEDWRLFVATSLYSELKIYENTKSSFQWQRESAEMATVLESLFTAGDARNEEVMYRLRKRIAVLLAWKFPEIEKDIKELYSARSAFVHGSFFEHIAKESPRAYNNIPSPDFDLLYKHKEYVRLALVAYLHLAQVVREGGIEGVSTVMDALERSIIDVELRKKINAETQKLFALMPEPTLKMLIS